MPSTSRRRSRGRPWSARTISTPSSRSSRPRASWWGRNNCRRNNNFEVQITTPQSVGVHEFQLQAEDDAGHISRLGKPFLIKVVPRRHHPK